MSRPHVFDLVRIGLPMCLAMFASCDSKEPSPDPSPSGTAENPAVQGVAGQSTVIAGSSSVTGQARPPSSPAGGAVGTAGVSGGSSSAVAGTGSSAAGKGAAQAEHLGVLPCNVSKVLAQNCQQCHGVTPIGGAPMSLVTFDDLHKPAPTQPSLKVYELSKQRIGSQAKPMPPGGEMGSSDFGTLNTWLESGALAGGEADMNCGSAPATQERPGDLTYGPLTPEPGETCYDFPVHESQTLDDSPYSVPTGEHYEQFYFRPKWPKGTVATRYGTNLGNEKIVHHWLLFSTIELDAEGTHKTSPLPWLQGVNATLRAGWAVGGANLSMPTDVGLELPDPGTTINVQLHYYNSTGTVQTDRTVVQVCTVPAGTRKHTASMTWVGNENLGGNVWFGGAGMPPHKVSTFSGTCNPLREGMNSTDPIHILAFWPHMHTLGTNMKTVINRRGGTAETIFDKPFDFNRQIHYPVKHELMPGDTLTATCTFNNTTDKGVPFGESTDSEMCYQFVYSYPAHALENHVLSLLGATNTCW